MNAGLVNAAMVQSVVNLFSHLVVNPKRFLAAVQAITETVRRGVIATHTVRHVQFRDVMVGACPASCQAVKAAFCRPNHATMVR